MAISRFQIAKKDIQSGLADLNRNVLTKSEIREFLRKNRQFWRLAQSTNTNKFIEELIKYCDLKEVNIGDTLLYTYGYFNDYELFQSLKKDCFYSHFTAIRLHELTEQTPHEIYISTPRNNTASPDSTIAQEKIDQAFSMPPRIPKNVTVFGPHRIMMISNVMEGSQVTTKTLHEDNYEYTIKLSSLEKTLIDAAIRPHLCGGVRLVLDAFKSAIEKGFSVNKALSILYQNKYSYPYEQVLGFYLEKAGYRETQLNLVKKKITNKYKLYIDHEIPEKYLGFDEKWNVYYPSHLF